MSHEGVNGLVFCFTEHKCGVCAEAKEPNSLTTMQNTISKILLEVGDNLESIQTLFFGVRLRDG